jgi:N-acetylglucosaminyl-diphospho-decaprenol L-rhamnosyltransferase
MPSARRRPERVRGLIGLTSRRRPSDEQYRDVDVGREETGAVSGREYDVDVVVLTWNDGELLRHAVESALASLGVDAHVVVVDNGSDDPLVLTPSPRVTIVRNEENRGVAAGRNQGVAQGRAPFVLLLDSDARLEPHAVAELLVPLRADDTIALAAPVMIGQSAEDSAGRAPSAARKVARFLGATSAYAPGGNRTGPWWDVDFGIGACQLFRRVAYESIDGLDESFFYGPEDVDFCLRLRQYGWRVVQVRRASVDHPARRRFRNPLSRRGVAHAWAVTRFLWRHRRFAPPS